MHRHLNKEIWVFQNTLIMFFGKKNYNRKQAKIFHSFILGSGMKSLVELWIDSAGMLPLEKNQQMFRFPLSTFYICKFLIFGMFQVREILKLLHNDSIPLVKMLSLSRDNPKVMQKTYMYTALNLFI